MPFPSQRPAAKVVPIKRRVAEDDVEDAKVVAKKPAVKKPKLPPLTAKQKAKLVAFKAPSDFRPAYIEIKFLTQHDGLIHPKIFGERIRGRWDNPDARRYNMAEYDQVTLAGIASRLQASCYSSNFHRRLPPGERFSIILRVTKKAADDTLSVRIQAAAQYVERASGWKPKWFEDKKDPVFAKIRRSARLLRGAFVQIQLPPAGRQPKKAED